MNILKNNKRIYRRGIAYIIDWYLASLLAMVPFVLIGLANNMKYYQFLNIELLTFQETIIAICISLAFTVLYFYIVPLRIFPGQTLGKKFMKLKIIEKNQNHCYAFHLFIRQIIMILFIEISLYSIGGIFINSLVRLTQIEMFLSFANMSGWITLLSVIMMLLSRTHIALHDFLSHTIVIEVKN